jgi:peptide/nickel transport system substrate-binding protein
MVAGFLLGLSPLTRAASETPKRGGTLTFGIRKDLTVMNPFVRTMSTDESIREPIFEPLLKLDEKGNIIPWLAESWEVAPGGRTYTFHLRRGVKFHDGREMTAEDVKFAIDYTLNPKNGAYGNARLSLVEGAETAGKYTVKIQVKRNSAAFASVLTDIKAFSVVPKGSIAEGVSKPKGFPPGTGPFKFAEWVPGQRIVLERFDDYWGKKAYLDKVILRPISDDTVRFNALRSGDVDIIERTPYEWAKQVLDGKFKGLGVAEAKYAGYRAMFFNVVDPPFDDRNMRLAVGHAIDRKELLHAAYFGFGEIADQKYPKGHAWYIDGLEPIAYDPEKARKYLKAAGYNGQVIEMKIEKGADVETMATTLQAQLKKIGMNVKLQVYEYGARREQIRRGETTFDLVGSGFYADPSTTYRQELACESDPRKRTMNWTGYCNKEWDALHEKLETELDTQKRKEILKQLLTIRNRDLPLISIGFTPRFFVFQDYVKNFSTGADDKFGGPLSSTWLDK